MTKDEYKDMYPEATTFANPDYEQAMIGYTSDGRAVYDREKMVEALVDTEGMTAEDADEFISYNTERALGYIPDPPVVISIFEEG